MKDMTQIAKDTEDNLDKILELLKKKPVVPSPRIIVTPRRKRTVADDIAGLLLDIETKLKTRPNDSFLRRLNAIKGQSDSVRKKGDLIELLTDINEILEGKIRVYVRIKPLSGRRVADGKKKWSEWTKLNKDKNIIGISDNKLAIRCIVKGRYETNEAYEARKNVDSDDYDEYGPFRDIFTPDKSNSDIFDNIKSFFDWENIKYKTTVFMNYGISGSGKSFTFFGKLSDGSLGLVNLIIKNFLDAEKQVELYQVFEEYLDINELKSSKAFKTDESDFISKYVTDAKIYTDKFKGKRIPLSEFENNIIENDTKINSIITQITKKRIKNGTIKKTPNNKESSRSHLYLVFKISDGDDEGYIVFIDTAGRESPLEIIKSYLNTTDDFVDNIFTIQKASSTTNYYFKRLSNDPDFKYLRDSDDDFYNLELFGKSPSLTEQEQRLLYIQRVVEEGFYINESLNHLVKYLDPRTKIIKQPSLKLRDYKLESDENSVYTFFGFKDDKPIENNIKTFEIFDELKNLSASKQFKFGMICNTRQEEEKCNSIKSTFEFVNKIKSTPTI
jgi:hypothetical protein